ncbi:MAG: DUF6588 family protein [Bacteroidota bacterium]
MRNSYKTIRQLAVATVLSTFTLQSMAQTDAGALIKAGTADANSLMNAYMGPMLKSFGAGLNGGWFQTAKPHGIGGFDITISGNLTFAPTSDLSYNVQSLGLQKIRLMPGEDPEAPTIFGTNKDGPKVGVYEKSPFTGNDTAMTTFNLPPGLGANMFAVPTAQFSVGVGFGTEVGIRFIPTVNAGDVKVGLFGFAVKHDFKQWIPGMKEMPFDLSAMFGYTSMSAEVGFTGDNAIKPESDPNIYNANPGKTYDNQKIELNSSAWTLNVIVSKKLGPLTPYLGLGYQKATTDLDLKGDYPVTVPNDQAAATDPTDPSFLKPAKVMNVTDPVSISGDISGFRATAGIRLKLLVLTIHGDYTFGAYNVASVGVGLNLQSIVPFKL